LSWPFDELSAALLALTAATTLPTRQVLTPAIDRAPYSGEAARFEALQGASVAITLVHIALAAGALARFAAGVAA
jgi:hypothetical protein